MIRSAARSTWIATSLLVLAAVMLVSSFVPWRTASPTMADAPTATAIPATTPALTLAETGRSLFAVKGCPTCHRHDGLESDRLTQGGQVVPISRSWVSSSGAPDLTHYQPDAAFVREWLKNPQAIRPNTAMPNLGLSDDEIEALLAFLQTDPTD